MTLESIIAAGGTLVYDPLSSSLTPDEFLLTYGERVDTIAIVAKSEAGSTYYPSSTAPKDPRYGETFSSFTQILTDIGIEVYGLMQGNVDGFFSRDPNFRMHRTGGNPIEGFVCPNQENYWFYLSEIAAEIATRSPVSGIILSDILYPRDNYCFCENCRRPFSQDNGIDRDFGLEFLNKRPDLKVKWEKTRIDAIRTTISSIVNRVHQERKLEIIAEIMVDPQTNYFKGASEHFGHDLTNMTQVTPHLLLHFYPWSPFPQTESEIEQLIGNMNPIMERMTNTKNSLFLWEPSDASFTLAQILKQALGSDYVFFTEQKPRSYLDRRTLHLDLGV
ncbi:MAG: hypothetical protein ACXAE3_04875 [Candidatus Kariarchaeaceae archaeon]|jgi:hypothetical protein